mgnify:CR=1 FL=1
MNAERRKTDSRGHVKWSEHDRKQFMDACRKSGKTKKEFCREHGIKEGTFYGWYKKSSKKPGRNSSKPKFQEINIPVQTCFPVQINLPGGARVSIRNLGSREELISLIRGVAGC